jgi:hypothetical protein
LGVGKKYLDDITHDRSTEVLSQNVNKSIMKRMKIPK